MGYGLIISDYNSNVHYSPCIANEQNQVSAALHFQNKDYALVPSAREKYDKDLKLSGVALTKAGKELIDIIPITNSDSYADELVKYLESKHLDIVEIK